MSSELIERLAQEAGFQVIDDDDTGEQAILAVADAKDDGILRIAITPILRRFTALVAHECAQVADEAARKSREVVSFLPQASYGEMAANACARQIRAKFKDQ